jgi:Na+-transporting NADH:ubiquinone oxidoreductase subunit C
MQHSVGYTIGFAAAVCLVCSLFVAASAVTLADRQTANKRLDLRKKVLAVASLMDADRDYSPEEIDEIFEANLKPHVVDLATGKYVQGIDPGSYDARKARRDPELSVAAPKNLAKVSRVAKRGVIYLVQPSDEIEGVIIPVEGMGLWSTLYGYLALDADTRTVQGLTFYEHGETPGLGGEVDNPRWKALWPGRLAFDANWVPAIAVLKGRAGSVEEDPYHVDGLSGATITSKGVTNLLQFWLGKSGYGPYLAAYRTERGT